MIERLTTQNAAWKLECLEEKDGTLVPSAARTVQVGLGPQAELTPERVRQRVAKGIKAIRAYEGDSVAIEAAPVLSALGTAGLTALVQGAELAAYVPKTWKTGDKKTPLSLYCTGVPEEHEDALRSASVLAQAVKQARDLVNEPANFLTPNEMAKRIQTEFASAHLQVEVLEEAQLQALGMGGLLAVGGGAGQDHRPCLVVLRYARGAETPPIALVGKGITCDTGGYCLKAASAMKGIKGDMAGAAAVLGALKALDENAICATVVGILPLAENRISPDSFIPGDILQAMNGRTIEVGNTDAEGRLILADAVTYAIRNEGAAQVVDIATLTGAVVTMFGFTTAGVMSNNEAFYQTFCEAAQISGEQYWRLPMFPEYRAMLESDLADISNISKDGCGTITAGMFLADFAEGKPWIHLDIAGTAWVDSPKREYQSKGATGAGVMTLYELCKRIAF